MKTPLKGLRHQQVRSSQRLMDAAEYLLLQKQLVHQMMTQAAQKTGYIDPALRCQASEQLDKI